MKKYKFLLIVFLLFLSFWTFVFISQQYWQYKTKKSSQIPVSTGINSFEKVNLGRVDQWILLRGWDRANPVVLFLHGGPGAALFPRARDIGVRLNLEKHFMMVYWEQRGTGKSFRSSIPEESMTIEQLVNDTIELATILTTRFKTRKIILVGRSFGSLIGILAADQHSELFLCYVGIGQMVYPLKNDTLSYHRTIELAQRFNKKKALKELKKIGYPPYDPEQLINQRRWLTSFYHRIMAEKFNIKRQNQWKILLATPEYTISDIIRMGMDPFYSIKHLWNEKFYQINLFEQIPRIEIPVYFIAGRYDYFTSSEIVADYYQKLKAPRGKHMIWFEQSGHQPETEEPDLFYDVMVNQVLSNINNDEN